MVMVLVLGVGAYFLTAFAIAPLPTMATGQCLNGIHAGVELTTRETRPVDCATAHENEVVGSITHPGSGAYPSAQALFDFADLPCREAFEAYVGISFEASVLDMILITPSDLSWLKGDRRISCVVVTIDGSKLTGSVRGTAR